MTGLELFFKRRNAIRRQLFIGKEKDTRTQINTVLLATFRR